MDAAPARSYIPDMDFEPVFSAVADTLRAIPRSELLVAALAAMVVGWIGAVIAKRSALGGLLRMAGVDVRYAGINLRGFRQWEVRDARVLGAYANGFDVAWHGRLRHCEAMGAGSANGQNGDSFNGHDLGVWEHEGCYGHDSWDDGWSSHENCQEIGWGSIAEYNFGNGFIPAYGAQAVGHNLISRKNGVSPIRPGWKLGGFAALGAPAAGDSGAYTSFELYGCRSYGDSTAYYDSATASGGVTPAFLKATGCAAYDSTVYGYKCSTVEDCRYGGTGAALAPGVTASASTLLGA